MVEFATLGNIFSRGCRCRVTESEIPSPSPTSAANQPPRTRLRQVAERMQDMQIVMDWTDAAKKHLAKAGFDPIYGARPLRRAVTNEVEDLVAEQSLEGRIKAGDHVTLDVADDRLTLVQQAPAESNPSESAKDE